MRQSSVATWSASPVATWSHSSVANWSYSAVAACSASLVATWSRNGQFSSTARNWPQFTLSGMQSSGLRPASSTKVCFSWRYGGASQELRFCTARNWPQFLRRSEVLTTREGWMHQCSEDVARDRFGAVCGGCGGWTVLPTGSMTRRRQGHAPRIRWVLEY